MSNESFDIRGAWTKSTWEGSCSICPSKSEHVAKIEYNNQTLRLCPSCADSLNSILSSMLEDAP
jgi:ribosome-binding protein aMBF1 (putative translation factor)